MVLDQFPEGLNLKFLGGPSLTTPYRRGLLWLVVPNLSIYRTLANLLLPVCICVLSSFPLEACKDWKPC